MRRIITSLEVLSFRLFAYDVSESLKLCLQVPGVIVMEIQSADIAELEGGTTDKQWKRLVVVLNACPGDYSGGWPKGRTPLLYTHFSQLTARH